MNFRFIHYNFNVLDLEKSIKFYNDALDLKEVRRLTAADGSYIIVYLGDGQTDNEMHLAFRVDDYDAAYARHKAMNCICYENPAMGIYFINDPDGYWLEIVPTR